MPNSPRLAGKITLVTGAASGFGAGIARAYAREGATVADALAAVEARPPFAVAVNTTFVPNTRYAAHALQPGDRVEIISPVTGG